jgi:hypothetical protein
VRFLRLKAGDEWCVLVSVVLPVRLPLGVPGEAPFLASACLATLVHVEARSRFITALAKRVSDEYYASGEIYLSVREIDALAEAESVPENEARAALRLLDDNGLLIAQEGGHSYSDGMGLALRYEDADRQLFRQRNGLRREILALTAKAYDEGIGELVYEEGNEQFLDRPWAEAYAASRALEYMGLVDVRPFLGHDFQVSITSAGYELQRNPSELHRELPTTAAEDETATANVAPDALQELILTVEDLLGQRGWDGAAEELRRGDDQYREGHWTDAVREYYATLESGLKHRLDDAAVGYSAGAALKDLAKSAASHGLIPTNYQALFGFIDSIRSPRSHGRGGAVSEVEVGQAEALLMGNHVRALLLYLGHRPT